MADGFAQSDSINLKTETKYACTRTGIPVLFIDGVKYTIVNHYKSGNIKTVARTSRNGKRVFNWLTVSDKDDSVSKVYSENYMFWKRFELIDFSKNRLNTKLDD